MKKLSILMLCAIMASPAFANEYDDYGTYDDEYDSTYTSYDAPTPAATTERRDTYAGFRIHRNEHIAYNYEIHNGHHTTIRDNNFGFGLNVGNRLTDYVKLEFETMYTGLSESRHETDFDYSVWSNMLNVHLFKNYGGAVEPYAGIGIGLSGIWGDVDGAWGKSNDCDFDLSFAVSLGVNFALNKYVDLNLGLRYVDYGTVKHESAKTNIDATEIYVGAAYRFSIFD